VIQRVQTLFYLAIVAVCAMMLFSPTDFYAITSEINPNEEVHTRYAETIFVAADGTSSERNVLLAFLVGAIGIMAFVAIFSFKNRKLQVLLSGFIFLFVLAVVVVMYLSSLHIDYFEKYSGGFQFHAILPLAIIMLNASAMRGVRRDEKIIRQMDRLR
jgi:hypothetical protein